MNNQTRLLSKIITDRDLSLALEGNVNEAWFSDVSDRAVFRFLHNHYSTYQECPSLDVIKDNFPTYSLVDVDDSIHYLIDSLVADRRKQTIVTTIGSALEAMERNKDHESALRALELGLIKLEEDGLNKSNDLEITRAAKRAIEEYEHRKNNPGLLGIPTGFPTMDEATSGLQPGQLVVIIAPPKTGKSTLALQIAINSHLMGKVPMFYSFEMSNAEQKSRYYAMRSRISHKRLMTGSLTEEEEKRYYKIVQGIEHMRDKFWFVDSSGGQTVSGIASKIQSKNPDIVFIDGTYLMIDEQTGESNTPQALTNITRSLKRLAQKINKPIVVSTQVLSWKMKKNQVTADSIGYSSSFHQDADVIFGLQRVDENTDDLRTLKIVASRNSGLSEVALCWDWNTGEFREVAEIDLGGLPNDF
jgi:replicative DNA helicase